MNYSSLLIIFHKNLIIFCPYLLMGDRVTYYLYRNFIIYDIWFEMHSKEYNEQLEFLRTMIPKGRGIEMGVGTGKLATPRN
jgi:hypothetical protein